MIHLFHLSEKDGVSSGDLGDSDTNWHSDLCPMSCGQNEQPSSPDVPFAGEATVCVLCFPLWVLTQSACFVVLSALSVLSPPLRCFDAHSKIFVGWGAYWEEADDLLHPQMAS